jgi:copper transport protein
VRLVALLLCALAALANASAAHAHASLVRSDPLDRAAIAQAPDQLSLTFNGPVSPLLLRLVRPSGEIADLVATMSADGATVILRLPPDMSSGTHLLSWRVVSSDGHPVGGSLTFSIGQPSAVPALAVTGDTWLRSAIWLARIVLYVGLFVGAGGVFFLVWIATGPRDWSRAAVRAALLCGLIGVAFSAALHGADLSGSALWDARHARVWWRGIASTYGWTLGAALVALGLAFVALATRNSVARWWSALALAATGMALSASGHAATAGPQLVIRPAIFLHGVSVAFWLGALLPLAAALGRDQTGLARFSKAISWPFLVLVATGTLLAIIQVRQFEALWTTSYGLVLVGKLGAVCLLVGLAGANRWMTPRVATHDARATRLLRRSIIIEVAIMTVILGLVASWRFTPPPRAVLAGVAPAIHTYIHADRATAVVQIERRSDDSRRIEVVLQDRGSAPLTAKEVSLVLSKPDAGIEPLRLAAAHEASAKWKVDEVRLPIAGRWRLRIEILVNDFDKLALEDDIDLSR